MIIRVHFGFNQVDVFQKMPFLHFPYGSMLKHIVTPRLPTQSYERQIKNHIFKKKYHLRTIHTISYFMQFRGS